MIVRCPGCQTQYRLEKSQFKGRTQVGIHCTVCDGRFSVHAPAHTDTNSTLRMVVESFAASQGGGTLPEGKRISLVATQGPLAGKVFPITKSRVVLGRSGADIVLDDSDVSRQHCALEVRGITALLVDLGSSNGTFVDNKRIETCELEHLSEFRVGSTTMMFSIT